MKRFAWLLVLILGTGPALAETLGPKTTLDTSALDRVDVDPISGQLQLRSTDLVLGEGELELRIERTYRGSWTHSLDSRLHVEDGAAVFVRAGSRTAFVADAAGRRVAVAGFPAKVEVLKSGYRIRGLGDGRDYRFDARGLLVRRGGPGALKLAFAYDRSQRLVGVTGPWGTLTVERDAQGTLVGLIAPGGRRVRYQRDAAGDLVAVRRGNQHEAYGYDRDGRLVELAEGLANIAYGPAGRVISLTGDGVQPLRVRYTAGTTTLVRGTKTARVRVLQGGRVVQQTGFDGLTTRVELDARLRVVGVEAADGRAWTTAYDDAGRVSRRTGPEGATRFTYGSQVSDRPTRIELPDGRAIDFKYDLRGNVVRAESGGAVERTTYDRWGRLTARVDARGLETRYVRDARGLVMAVTQPGAGTTRYVRDASGAVQQVISTLR